MPVSPPDLEEDATDSCSVSRLGDGKAHACFSAGKFAPTRPSVDISVTRLLSTGAELAFSTSGLSCWDPDN